MIDPGTVDLMERDLDGSLTAAERAELERRLAEDPEARALHGEMAEVARHLTRAGDVEPSPGLHARILASVAARYPARSGGLLGWTRRFRPEPAAALRYGYALAAGLVLGLVAAAWLLSGPAVGPGLDLDSLAGTMAGRSPAPAPVDGLDISLPGLQGRVVLRPSATGFLLEPELRAAGAVEVALVFDAQEVEIRGFLDPEGDPVPFRVEPGRLIWTHKGSRRYAVLLGRRGGREATLALEFVVAGQRLDGGALRLPGGAGGVPAGSS